jgi:hypothetical protein
MSRFTRRFILVGALVLFAAPGCIPYTVGSTAETVPTGHTANATSWYFIPNAFKRPGDSLSTPLAGVDHEFRHGLDERSDVGLRLTSGLGVVVNYKRRFQDYGGGPPALAYMVGGGIVNGGEHLHLEATLIASGDERSGMMPFGGLRAMQVVPLDANAVHDSPTIGAFGGVQIGDASFIIRPEIGVFYDRSALGLRSANYIIVPALTLQRARPRHETRTIAPPAMAGSRPNPGERTVGRRIRCVLLMCPGP